MKRLSLLLLGITFLFASCSEKGYDGYTKNDNGLFYKFYVQNEGATPQQRDLIELQFACTVNDTTVIIPNTVDILPCIEPLFAGDIFEGLAMMHKGDSASFIVRIDSTFHTFFNLPQMPPQFKTDDVMRFDVKVLDFYSIEVFTNNRINMIKESYPEETAQADNDLKTYLKNKGINAEPQPAGFYYVSSSMGDGNSPKPGDTVKVHYVLRLTDGKQLESSYEVGEPIEFVLGEGRVIPGWDKGIQLMSKGEKGTLYIPFYLAYGPTGSGPIPAFSTLEFDVELVDFE